MIGIVTFWQAVNPGAFLQQYALQKTLEKLSSAGVEIIRFSSEFGYRELQSRFQSNKGLNRFTTLRDPFLFWKHAQTHCNYSSSILSAHDSKWGNYSTVVFGSDEIWNMHNWFSGGSPIYFGGNFNGPTKISYAASFGSFTNESELPCEFQLMLRQYKAISVRDLNSQNLVNEITSQKPPILLDPTFLYNFDSEMKPLEVPRERYICVYATRLPSQSIKAIENYADQQQLNIVITGFRQPCNHQHLYMSNPFGALKILSSADIVFTNTFHGVLFCVQQGKRFFLDEYKGKENKINSVLNDLSITSDAFERKLGLNTLYYGDESFREVKAIIADKKMISLGWLARFAE